MKIKPQRRVNKEASTGKRGSKEVALLLKWNKLKIVMIKVSHQSQRLMCHSNVPLQNRAYFVKGTTHCKNVIKLERSHTKTE